MRTVKKWNDLKFLARLSELHVLGTTLHIKAE